MTGNKLNFKSDIVISKTWHMPNKNTYDIKPIHNIIKKYIFGKSVDPFANKSKLCTINNDIDPSVDPDTCMDALLFLKSLENNSIDFLLFDPPYSVRQVSEVYNKFNISVNMETTQSTFWTKLKNEISRVCKLNSIVISFGWNSNGIGKNNGFEQLEILIVSHGGIHNDTIVTVEKLKYKQEGLFIP